MQRFLRFKLLRPAPRFGLLWSLDNCVLLQSSKTEFAMLQLWRMNFSKKWPYTHIQLPIEHSLIGDRVGGIEHENWKIDSWFQNPLCSLGFIMAKDLPRVVSGWVSVVDFRFLKHSSGPGHSTPPLIWIESTSPPRGRRTLVFQKICWSVSQGQSSGIYIFQVIKAAFHLKWNVSTNTILTGGNPDVDIN